MNDHKRRRVFIANIDQYDAFYIGKALSEAKVGSTLKFEDEEQLEEEENDISPKTLEETYQIFCTLSSNNADAPIFVTEVFPREKRQELYDCLVTCDYILYNVKDDSNLIDEAQWMVETLHENMDNSMEQKMFILLSSVLTWAKSPVLDENDPDLPFSDEDYPRRKAHTNFREHLKLEKTTIHLGKTDKLKLLTYVLVSGVTYGEKQNVLHHFFKSAWNNSTSLIVPEGGQNIVPTIHVKDLASVIQSIMEVRPTKHYIIAKDESQCTLHEIIKAISKGLSTGKVKTVTREEAFLTGDLTQNHIDQLLINLRMEPSFLKEHARFRWHCEGGLVEDMSNIIKEFKLARQLIPIRLCIQGPPASGKTTLAKRLCEYYKLHHIHIKGVIEESLATLKRRIEAAAAGGANDKQPLRGPKQQNDIDIEEDDDGQDGDDLGDSELMEAIQQNMEENNGRLDVEYLNSAADGENEEEAGNEMDEGQETREKTDTTPTASELFAKQYLSSGFDITDVREEPRLLPRQPIPTQLPKGLLPNYVLELQASDKFLRDRIMNMPESKVHGTHYTEAGLVRRLGEYRSNQLGINPLAPATTNIPISDLESAQISANQISPLASASINENSVRAYFDSKGVIQIPINVMSDESEVS
ncbi:adenylate kinase 7 isoform X2 [Paragonimus heterotremus]|uniref:Adenylate kinase 7 isoform X2 n=1 Tax=Paragonimus heterotremus TaxID=100268 RepID=A0A8J4WHY7_9TREM|nr:adenylate kinase 7 isoform X2 [Paragonimus heterotremus]